MQSSHILIFQAYLAGQASCCTPQFFQGFFGGISGGGSGGERFEFWNIYFQLLSWNILSVEGELVRWYCWRNLQRKMWTANTDVLKSLFHCGKCLICKLFHKCLTKTGDKHIQPVNIQVEIIQNKTIWPGTTSTSCQTTSGQAINQSNLYDLFEWHFVDVTPGHVNM